VKIYSFPYYCGGRIIAGLYNPHPTTHREPGDVYKASLGLLGVKPWGGPSFSLNEPDPHPYLPLDFVEFLQILRKFCYADHGQEGYQGVIYAVTNSSQTQAQKWLPDVGFKKTGEYSKTSYNHNCISWAADYRKDMYPILQKVPDYVDKKATLKNEAPKFARPTGTQIPQREIPQPMPTTVYDTVRDSAQQTLSAAASRQSQIRTNPFR
jgi:hypothetical protein